MAPAAQRGGLLPDRPRRCDVSSPSVHPRSGDLHTRASTGPAFTPFASRVLRSLSEVATEARTASATATVVIEASRLGRSVEVGPAKQLAQNMVVDLPRDLSQYARSPISLILTCH